MGTASAHNARILTGARLLTGEGLRPATLVLEDGRIAACWDTPEQDEALSHYRARHPDMPAEDLGGKIILAGGIDAHVHFREPGMTHKADLASESRAALLGGVSSFIDMPNTLPPTLDEEALKDKIARAGGRAWAHFAFHIGASDDNVEQIEGLCHRRPELFAGIKVFMGSSTGNLRIARNETLERLFAIPGKPILVHAEDEALIRSGLEAARKRYGNDIPFAAHAWIRGRQACIAATRKALDLALRHGTRLHLLHISTEEELELIVRARQRGARVSAETCPHYLWFDESDYGRLGARIKCNPAVKQASDRRALRDALRDGTIDTLGTDHAPHLKEEKEGRYAECPSGLPSIQQALSVLWTVALQERIPAERIAALWSENAARLFHIKDRGFLREGSRADLVILDPDKCFTVSGMPAPRTGDSPSSSAWTDYRCGWTPYEGAVLQGAIQSVFLEGEEVVRNGKPCSEKAQGTLLEISL